MDTLAAFLSAHTGDIGIITGSAVSAILSSWTLLTRFRRLLREEITAIAATKGDLAATNAAVAHVDGKLDVVIDVIKTEVFKAK